MNILLTQNINEHKSKCTKCMRGNASKMKLFWSPYLFLYCEESPKLIQNCSFTRGKEEYTLIGGILKQASRKEASAFVNINSTWILCGVDKNEKIEKWAEFCNNANVKLLLFKKSEQEGEHPTVNKKETKDGDENIGEDRGTHDKDEIERSSTSSKKRREEEKREKLHQESLEKERIRRENAGKEQEKRKEKEILNEKEERKTEKEKKEKDNGKEDIKSSKRSKAEIAPMNSLPVLRLPNQGNSCYIAACCQLLYCAHVRSNNDLFSFSNEALEFSDVVQAFHSMVSRQKLSKKSWQKFYDNLFLEIENLKDLKFQEGDSGKFYESFVEHIQPFLTEVGRQYLACTNLVNEKECRCGKQPQKQEGTVYFIQYAGSEDFDNEESFSNEWKHCFEYEDKCPKCKQNATIKNYFKNWPRFLFVIASNSHVFFRNALKYDFTVGSRYKATYSVVGAAIHTGMAKGYGHYTAVVKPTDDWFMCSDSFSCKVDNPAREIRGGVQLMLFERVDSEGEATDQEKKGGSSSNDQRKTNNKKVVSKATNSYQR